MLSSLPSIDFDSERWCTGGQILESSMALEMEGAATVTARNATNTSTAIATQRCADRVKPLIMLCRLPHPSSDLDVTRHFHLS
jgi:hypothetical protein